MKKVHISSQAPLEVQQMVHRKFLRNFSQTFLTDADIVICDVNPIDATRFPKAKYFVAPMTNADHIHGLRQDQVLIDLRDQREFLNTVYSTAEHTIMLALMLLRKQKNQAKNWNRYDYLGSTLRGKRVGIIGYGRIGKQVDNLFRCFGAETSYWDTYQWSPSTRAEVLMFSDILTIHTSFNKTLEAQQFSFKDSDFAIMRKGSYLINTARPCFDEDLIYKNHKHFGGIALDVMYDEPQPKMFNKLKDLDNVIITPHIGGCTIEDLTKTSEFCFDLLTTRMLEDDKTVKQELNSQA